MIRKLFRMRATQRAGIPNGFAARVALAALAGFTAVAVAATALLVVPPGFAAEAADAAKPIGPTAPAPTPAPDPASAPAPAPAAKPKVRETPKTWHATAFFSSKSQYRIIHYWSAGSSMRAESVIGGHPITTIVRDDRYVAIDRLTGKALDIERAKRASEEDKGRLRPFGIELDELRRAGAEKVEETRMSGVPVEVWRLTDKASRRTVWVTKAEPRVPLRAETFVRGSSDTITFEYSNWVFDLDIPEEFFETPSDLDVERLDYDEYEEKSAKGPVGPAPILYPDMLHGGKQ